MQAVNSSSRRRIQGTDAVQWTFLVQVAICVVPSMVVLAMGNYSAAAAIFYSLFSLLLVRLLIRQNAAEVTTLILACLPALMLLRDFALYSSVEVLLCLGLVVWLLNRRDDFLWLFESRAAQGLIAFSVIYWLISFIRTGDYSQNLRIFELAFSALSIRLLSRSRSYLATALVGVALSGFAMGAALLGQGDRLGMVRNEDVRLGNPVTFGIPMALIVLLCLADGGRWLLLDRSTVIRTAVSVIAGLYLLLSTSRGSWSVAAACMLTILIFAPRRFEMVRYLLVAAVGVTIWAHFSDTSTLDKYIYKTFYSEEEWSDVNARVAQWEAFPAAFADSPIFGFGPGSGKGVSLHYSGHNLIWHSLYLHIGIECGAIGLLLLAAFLGCLIANGFKHLREQGEVVPLLGVIGFMTIGVSIPSIDGAAGLLLGMSLAGAAAPQYRLVRTVLMHAPARRRRAVPQQ